MLTALSVFRVSGDKLDTAGVILLAAFFRFNNFKSVPIRLLGPLSQCFRI